MATPLTPAGPARRGGWVFRWVELAACLGSALLLLAVCCSKSSPPARARVDSRASLCRANLKVMATAHRKFASNQIREGLYVPGTATIEGVPAMQNPPAGTWWVPEVVWARNGINDPDCGRYRGQGVLVNKNLISPEVMYCPAWDDEKDGGWLPGKSDPGGFGGWTTEALAQRLNTMVCTYDYRGSFGTRMSSPSTFTDPKRWMPAKAGEDSEGEALMSDVLVMPNPDKRASADPDYASFRQHDPCVSVAYLDSHVEAVKPVWNVTSGGEHVWNDFATINTATSRIGPSGTAVIGTQKGWGAAGATRDVGSRDMYVALEVAYSLCFSTNGE